jgi:hypothetical protein
MVFYFKQNIHGKTLKNHLLFSSPDYGILYQARFYNANIFLKPDKMLYRYRYFCPKVRQLPVPVLQKLTVPYQVPGTVNDFFLLTRKLHLHTVFRIRIGFMRIRILLVEFKVF